jgi:hypothetical protein
MNPRLLLVARPGPARDAYRNAVEEQGGIVDLVDGLADLPESLKTTPYNGLLLDVATLIKAPPDDKALVADLIEMFPAVRVNWDPGENRVVPLLYGRPSADGFSLAEFIHSDCMRFSARIIRAAPRRPIHLNVLLFKEGHGVDRTPERSVTLDLSEAGCFAVSFEDWRGVDLAWVRFHDFADKTLVEATVKWQVFWGKSGRVPGLGLAFDHMTDAQRQEIRERLGLARPPLPSPFAG